MFLEKLFVNDFLNMRLLRNSESIFHVKFLFIEKIKLTKLLNLLHSILFDIMVRKKNKVK